MARSTVETKLDAMMKMLESMDSRLTALENSKNSQAKATKTSKKSSAPVKKSADKQTWEEHLDATFGSKDERSKFVELRKKVSAEFKVQAEACGKYIPKKSYKKVLNDTTVSLNGKFNKKSVATAFAKAAK